MPRNNTERQRCLDMLAMTTELAAAAGLDSQDILAAVTAALAGSTSDQTAETETDETETIAVEAIAAEATDAGAKAEQSIIERIIAESSATATEAAAQVDADEDTDAAELSEEQILAALDGEVDEAVLAQVRPQEITLYLKATAGFTLRPNDALAALNAVLPSIVDVVGAVNPGPLVEDEDDESLITVVLSATAAADLSPLGAGRDGFNGTVQLDGAVDIVITSRVGDIADLDLATQLGLAPLDLPDVPEGQHPINGVLGLIEEQDGVRPEAHPVFTVSYTKDDGQALSEDDVEAILAHPISRPLSRFGAIQLVGVTRGQSDAERVAHIALLTPGEIDLATVAIGAAAYRGTFDFGGTIGAVTANGAAALANAEVLA